MFTFKPNIQITLPKNRKPEEIIEELINEHLGGKRISQNERRQYRDILQRWFAPTLRPENEPRPKPGEVNRHNVDLPSHLEEWRWKTEYWPHDMREEHYEAWAWRNAQALKVLELIHIQNEEEQPYVTSEQGEGDTYGLDGDATETGIDGESENGDAQQCLDVDEADLEADAQEEESVLIRLEDDIQRTAWLETREEPWGRPRTKEQRLVDFLIRDEELRSEVLPEWFEDSQNTDAIDTGSEEATSIEDWNPVESTSVTEQDASDQASPERSAPFHRTASANALRLFEDFEVDAALEANELDMRAAGGATSHDGEPFNIFSSNFPRKPLARRPVAHPPPRASNVDVVGDLAAYYAVADEGAMYHRYSHVRIGYREFGTHNSEWLPQGSLQALLASPSFRQNKCDTLGFDPSEGETFVRDGVRCLNMCKPLSYLPAEGDVNVFFRILVHMCKGDIEGAAEIAKIFAFLVQHPGEKLSYVPYLVGKSSVNKELLTLTLRYVLGPGNMRALDPQTFSGQFTDWLRTSSTLVLPQVSSSKGYQERMLHILTAPDLMVNLKGHSSVQVRNIVNLIAFGRDMADLASFPDPRRLAYFDIDGSSVTAQERGELESWLANDGKSHLRHYFLTLDLDAAGFNPLASPNNGTVGDQLEALSRSPTEDFLREALAAGTQPLEKDLVTLNEITHWLANNGHHVKQTEVRSALQEMGALHIGQKRVSGRKPNLWAVRRQDHWVRQGESEIARYLGDAG